MVCPFPLRQYWQPYAHPTWNKVVGIWCDPFQFWLQSIFHRCVCRIQDINQNAFCFRVCGQWQIIFDIDENIIETILGDMMYKIEDKIDSDNEDVEEEPTFGNEDKWTIVLVWRRVTVAKAKERVLLLFKRTELDKDGVPHLYTVKILKTKAKLFHLAICYILCGTFFLMATNIINYTYKVLSNPFLRFCTCYHVSNFVKVVCVINLQPIFDILWCSWAFSLALDFLTHQNWRAPKSRGEMHLRVSQSQVVEVETWRHAPGFQF
jgi:hypothetical protein